MRRLLLILFVLVAAAVSAQDEGRPVNASYMFAVGSAHTADTYLSPLKYTGTAFALRYDRCQTTPFSPEWQYRLGGRLGLTRTRSEGSGTLMWGAELDLRWGLTRCWQLPHALTLAVGPALALDAGCRYIRRNSNNPVSANAALSLAAVGAATWRTSLAGKTVALSWQPALDMIGAAFGPQYDELYYEIYLGNRSGIVHAAWPGNRLRLNNLVAVDLYLSNTAVRLGFESNTLSAKLGDNVTRVNTFAFVIGLSGNWISVKP